MAGPILTEISDIFTAAGISDDYISLVFKAVAVCFITQITADICRDSGETAIASAAELWGRAALVFMSLPVMRVLMEIINIRSIKERKWIAIPVDIVRRSCVIQRF